MANVKVNHPCGCTLWQDDKGWLHLMECAVICPDDVRSKLIARMQAEGKPVLSAN